MPIVVTGSLGFDYIMDFPGKFSDRIMPDRIHNISLSFLVEKLEKQWGGTAGNICYTLGLFKNNPILFATAGNDFANYKTYLEKNGVNTSYVKQYKDISTGSYFVITDQENNQIGAFYTGAMQHARKLSLLSLKKLFSKNSLQPRKDYPFSLERIILYRKKSVVVIAPNDPQAMKNYVKECQNLKIPYMYDPAFQIDMLSKNDLRIGITNAEILIGNDYEIALILKKIKMTKNQLLKKMPIIITTLGSKGAIIDSRSTTHNSQFTTIRIKPANPKNTNDPTGAGDAFRAGFLAGYTRGLPLQTCGQMGATAAVYTVEKYGTTTHTFTLDEFAKRYRMNYKIPLAALDR